MTQTVITASLLIAGLAREPCEDDQDMSCSCTSSCLVHARTRHMAYHARAHTQGRHLKRISSHKLDHGLEAELEFEVGFVAFEPDTVRDAPLDGRSQFPLPRIKHHQHQEV